MTQSDDYNDKTGQVGDMGLDPISSPFSANFKSEMANSKAEFDSNFGGPTGAGGGATGSAAVSQIFREGGFVGENRSRQILLGVLAVLLLGGFWMFFGGDDYHEDPEVTSKDESLAEKAKDADEEIIDDEKADAKEAELAKEKEKNLVEEKPAATPVANDTPAAMSQSASFALPPATVPPTPLQPAEGALYRSDESAIGATFTWEGSPGGVVVLSRNASMRPVVARARVQGNSYTLRRPEPGTWYWQVRNGAGKSSPRVFQVEGPVPRQIALTAPAAGGAVAGNGGVVMWTGDTKVTYYRVELSNSGDWTKPAFRFATSATGVTLQGVSPGAYQLRIGGFSEVSGHWEYTNPVSVTLQ